MDIILRTLRNYRHLLIIIIAFICYNSFFINKAFHIDDPFTIDMAKTVNINFFKPGIRIIRNPPFLAYYYAPIIKIFGEKEHWLHLFYFPFSLLVIVSMFFLSLRFSKKSLFPVLFLISTPAFIISSQSIMLDIPLLGFFLIAIATFIYGIDRKSNLFLVLSGLFAGIAILTKYSGLMVIPILFIYALLNSGKKKIKFLLIPVLIILLWDIYEEEAFFFAFWTTLGSVFLNRIGIRILASLAFLSGTSIVILFLSPLLLQKRKDLFCFFPSLASGVLPFMIKDTFSEYSFFEKSFLSILFVASSCTILSIVGSGFNSLVKKDNKDTFFLSTWFLLLFIFNILTNFIAARFSLLLLPPLFLFLYNKLSSCNFEIIKPMLKFVILLSLIFSTILAIGDYQFAGLYRHFVYSFKKITPLEEKEKIYFYHRFYYYSWGYAYYLEKFYDSVNAPYRIKERLSKEHSILITPTQQVLPIVIEKKSVFTKLLDLDYDKTLIDSIYYKGNVFLHNRKFHAGFYSHDWGLLPFNFSMRKVPFEVFEIYRLSYTPRKGL